MKVCRSCFSFSPTVHWHQAKVQALTLQYQVPGSVATGALILQPLACVTLLWKVRANPGVWLSWGRCPTTKPRGRGESWEMTRFQRLLGLAGGRGITYWCICFLKPFTQDAEVLLADACVPWNHLPLHNGNSPIPPPDQFSSLDLGSELVSKIRYLWN